MNTNRLALFAALAIGAIALLIVALWPGASPEPIAAVPLPTPPPATGAPEAPRARRPIVLSTPSEKPTPPAGGDTPAWENQIDRVLESNVSEAQTAQILLNMLPTLPEDGQVEAANHVTNLLPDENYSAAKPVLLNPGLAESVLSVFFTDLMNRSDQIKLRSFIEIAKIPNHPFHDEALEDLEIYLGENYGTDWTKWSSATEKYLKEADAQ